MPMVVSTTTSAGPDARQGDEAEQPEPVDAVEPAASMMSSGIALIAADSTVMAKPAWIQIITTIRKKRVPRVGEQELLGVEPEPDEDWLTRPIWLTLSRPVLVDELPDDRRADERDGHRQEDQRLGERLDAGPVDQHRVEQADRRWRRAASRGPRAPCCAARSSMVGVGEDRRCSCPGRRTPVPRGVLERVDDRADGRVDQADHEQQQPRARGTRRRRPARLACPHAGRR